MLHIGNRTTSSVESSNANIKLHLDSSVGDLATLFRKLRLFWRDQQATFDANLARGLYKKSISIQHPLIDGIVAYVTPQCLNILQVELRKIPQTGSPPVPMPCTCSLRKTHGLPCWHELWRRKDQSQPPQPLRIEDLHPFWLWDRIRFLKENRRRTLSPVQNQAEASRKGIPRDISNHGRGYGSSSTRRDPSAFEIAGQGPLAPLSTAPSRIRSPSSRIGSSTSKGIRRLQLEVEDTYEPGTQLWRRYQRTLTRLRDEPDKPDEPAVSGLTERDTARETDDEFDDKDVKTIGDMMGECF